MSDLNKNDIIKEYERSKKQEEKIDSLNENITKLNETITNFVGLLTGTGKKEGKEGKEVKEGAVPTKIEGNKEKEKINNNPSLLDKFLGW